MHVLLVNSDATMLEGNSSGMFKVAYSYMTSQDLSLILYSRKKKVTYFDTQLFLQGSIKLYNSIYSSLKRQECTLRTSHLFILLD